MLVYGQEKLKTVPANSQQWIKEQNAKQLFRMIAASPGISRTQLARESGLSPSTVSVIIEEMIRGGYLRQSAALKTPPSGRCPIRLDIDPEAVQIPTFSFKITGLLFRLYDLKMQVMEELFQPYGGDLSPGIKRQSGKTRVEPEAVAGVFRRILNRTTLFAADKAKAVMISFPGEYFEYAEVYSSSPLKWELPDTFLCSVRCMMGNLPIIIGDETIFIAYVASIRNRLMQGSALYVDIGDAVGSAIILNGQIFTGKLSTSGELGHISVDVNGRPCSCGGHGCLERYVTTDEIISSVLTEIHRGRHSAVMRLCDYNERRIRLETLSEALSFGDEVVVRVLQDVALKIVTAISNMMCVIGSMDVYFGGDVIRLGPVFLEMMKKTAIEHCNRHLFEHSEFRFADVPKNGECLGCVIEFINSYLSVTM